MSEPSLTPEQMSHPTVIAYLAAQRERGITDPERGAANLIAGRVSAITITETKAREAAFAMVDAIGAVTKGPLTDLEILILALRHYVTSNAPVVNRERARLMSLNLAADRMVDAASHRVEEWARTGNLTGPVVAPLVACQSQWRGFRCDRRGPHDVHADIQAQWTDAEAMVAANARPVDVIVDRERRALAMGRALFLDKYSGSSTGVWDDIGDEARCEYQAQAERLFRVLSEAK